MGGAESIMHGDLERKRCGTNKLSDATVVFQLLDGFVLLIRELERHTQRFRSHLSSGVPIPKLLEFARDLVLKQVSEDVPPVFGISTQLHQQHV